MHTPHPAGLPGTHLAPACCIPSPNATLAERVYCAYNAAGDPATVGRNARGELCPTWDALPPYIRAKWEGAVVTASGVLLRSGAL